MLQSMGFMSLANHKLAKAVVYAFVLVAMVVGLSLVPATAGTAQAACTTYTNIRAVNEGGGTPTNRNYYLYVYGTTQGGGTTYVSQLLYLNGKPTRVWARTSFVAVGLADNNRALKIGVSTAWAHANYGWQSRQYKYVRC